MHLPRRTASLTLLVLALAPLGCHSATGVAEDAPARERAILVAGRRVPVDAPVVPWSAPGGLDARAALELPPDLPAWRVAPAGVRYEPGRARVDAPVPAAGADLEALGRAVDLLVLHHGEGGDAHQGFQALGVEQGRSVHFVIDLDGTIYQTLDVAHTAHHAGPADVRGIGILLAGHGALRPREAARWDRRATGAGSGAREAAFAGDLRRERLSGTLNGYTLEQLDFTPEQYRSLARLSAALFGVLPRLLPDAPRDERGFLLREALSAGHLERFRGILGHYHVDPRATGPGPAFDWEGFLRRLRAELGPPRR